MKTIAIANQKGGVAKTTTARETAAMLAEAGAKVLALDLDGQHDLTNFFIEGMPGTTVSDVMAGSVRASAAVMETGRSNLWILGADDRAYSIDAAIGKDTAAVRRMLSELGNRFDYCVIDFPRMASSLTISALAASDYVVVPSEAERASANSTDAILSLIESVRDGMNDSLKVAGVLITRHNSRTTIAKQYAEILEETAERHGVGVFRSRIPMATAVSESDGYGMALCEYKPDSKPAMAYKDYLIELLAKMR